MFDVVIQACAALSLSTRSWSVSCTHAALRLDKHCARNHDTLTCTSSQELTQFRNLREKVIEVVSVLLRGRLPATTSMVANLIAIEVHVAHALCPMFA